MNVPLSYIRGYSITYYLQPILFNKGQKMLIFVHAQGIKTVHAGVGLGQKIAKFCQRSG